MKRLYTVAWDTDSDRGGVPGYGNVSKTASVVSAPQKVNGQIVPLLLFSDGRQVTTRDQVNWVVLSDGGQYAWLGLKDGHIYENNDGSSPLLKDGHPIVGYGQFSIIYVGEELKYFTDVTTFQQTQGGWRYVDGGQIVSIGETTGVAPGLRNYTQFPEVRIGQGQNGGLLVQLTGESFRRVLVSGDWFNIQVSRDGDTFSILAVSYTGHHTDVYEVEISEFASLPREPIPLPEFSFNHPVLIAPFKDPDKQSGARYRIDDGSLGIYTEAAIPLPVFQANPQTRVIFVHDAPTKWPLPSGARPFDLPGLEFYRLKTETLAQSVARWTSELTALLADWPGDVLVVPMFYCQGGAAGSTNPPETWTVEEVLDGLRSLSGLVNQSQRIKVIAPFAYNRANGITAHPELMQAWTRLLAAGRDVELTPVVVDTPHQPPTPKPQTPPVEESHDMDLDPKDKDEVCDAIGAVAAAAFGKNAASMSQGVRQAIDQDVTDVATLMLLAQAREGGASPQAVERAAAAGRLLQGKR